jgi:hypothetical protein
MFKKLLISAFVILNLGTVLWINRPKALVRQWDRALAACPSPAAAALRQADYLDQYYAHVSGLDPSWQMFGALSRFDWWYVIKARYADGHEVLLPLPLQSDRTWWERNMADFKEVKFHLNMYNDRPTREAYAIYLARLYPEDNGVPLKEIVWELHFQNLRPMEETRRLGSHLEPASHFFVLDTFPASLAGRASP